MQRNETFLMFTTNLGGVAMNKMGAAHRSSSKKLSSESSESSESFAARHLMTGARHRLSGTPESESSAMAVAAAKRRRRDTSTSASKLTRLIDWDSCNDWQSLNFQFGRHLNWFHKIYIIIIRFIHTYNDYTLISQCSRVKVCTQLRYVQSNRLFEAEVTNNHSQCGLTR